jgi:hypothetical protein
VTRLNLDGPVPCRFCGGTFQWRREREPAEPGDSTYTWSGLCPCGCEWNELATPEVPTWRSYAEDDRAVAALVAEVERLQLLLGHQQFDLRMAQLRVLALEEDGAELGAYVRALLALVDGGVLVTPVQHAARADEVTEVLCALGDYCGMDEAEA